jgi:tetratricopeptide (TPR) repeat protein
VEKNAVIVCILIQEEVNEAQSAYHLFLAGFLPTQMIKLKTGKISFGINQLLYGGGLFSYLEQFSISANSHKSDLSQSQIIKPQSTAVDLNIFYLNLGDEYFQKGEYAAAINSYNQALQFNNSDADIYYKLGLVNYQLGEYHTAITNYSQAINININHPQAYNQIGLVHYQIGNYHIAIEAYTQAIRINPHIAINYKNRADVRSHIGDTQGAIEDYNQAIKLNPDYATTQKDKQISRYLLNDQQQLEPVINIDPDDNIGYKNRGNDRAESGDNEGAIADYTQVIQINPDDIEEITQTIIQILQGTYPNSLMYEPQNLRQKVISTFGLEQFQTTLAKHLEFSNL